MPRLGLVMLAAILLPCCNMSADEEVLRLDFQTEVQNLRAIQKTFRLSVGDDFRVCPDLQGELRFGQIPYRVPGEKAVSTANFAHFAAAYGSEALPAVLIDYNRDKEIGCDEELPLLPHPDQKELAFRTVKLGPPGRDDSPRQTRRYRLLLPTELKEPRQDFYFVDTVDVPAARWEVQGRTTSWLLFDGNYDGVFDKRFGDGLLVDFTGQGRISLDPQGENFFSFHLPLRLPWGNYEVAEIDPHGRFLTLKRLRGQALAETEPLEAGDVAQAVACNDPAGNTIRIGGAGSKHQVVYFWLSHCGGCEADMQELTPLLEQFGPDRFQAIGVSLDEQPQGFDDFAGRHSGIWSHCFTGTTLWDNAIARRFGAVSPSDYVLLDPQGKILLQGRGIDKLRQALEEVPP